MAGPELLSPTRAAGTPSAGAAGLGVAGLAPPPPGLRRARPGEDNAEPHAHRDPGSDPLDLLRAGRAGDEPAFVALYEVFATPLSAYLWSRLRDRHDVEEVRQESFLRALRARRLPLAGSEVRPWLFAIASRLATDRLRRRAVRKRHATAVAAAAEGAAVVDPADAASLLEQCGRALAAVELLPEAQRNVVLLHCYGGLTFQEISGCVGASRSTVLARMRYAVDKLRQALKIPEVSS